MVQQQKQILGMPAWEIEGVFAIERHLRKRVGGNGNAQSTVKVLQAIFEKLIGEPPLVVRRPAPTKLVHLVDVVANGWRGEKLQKEFRKTLGV